MLQLPPAGRPQCSVHREAEISSLLPAAAAVAHLLQQLPQQAGLQRVQRGAQRPRAVRARHEPQEPEEAADEGE